MNEQVIKAIENLGSEGISAFYAYLVMDTLQFTLVLGAVILACRAIWPTIKKSIENM